MQIDRYIYICQNKGCEYPKNQQNICPAATPTCIYIYAMILSSILAGIYIYVYIYLYIHKISYIPIMHLLMHILHQLIWKL